DTNPMNDCENPYAKEECDDGNANENDSCLTSCEWNWCGDSQVYTTVTDLANPNPVEECDDGEDGSVACNGSDVEPQQQCKRIVCGDGVISLAAGETCDPKHPDFEDGGCSADCVVTTCGNGEKEGNEQCD